MDTYRNALARFRTSCHDLNIEVGRYINVDNINVIISKYENPKSNQNYTSSGLISSPNYNLDTTIL